MLREVRESKGISLRGAARDLDIDASYLSKVERGEKSISPAVLDRASNYYEMPREQFEFANGKLPSDIVTILRAHPEIVAQLRETYGTI